MDGAAAGEAIKEAVLDLLIHEVERHVIGVDGPERQRYERDHHEQHGELRRAPPFALFACLEQRQTGQRRDPQLRGNVGRTPDRGIEKLEQYEERPGQSDPDPRAHPRHGQLAGTGGGVGDVRRLQQGNPLAPGRQLDPLAHARLVQPLRGVGMERLQVGPLAFHGIKCDPIGRRACQRLGQPLELGLDLGFLLGRRFDLRVDLRQTDIERGFGFGARRILSLGGGLFRDLAFQRVDPAAQKANSRILLGIDRQPVIQLGLERGQLAFLRCLRLPRGAQLSGGFINPADVGALALKLFDVACHAGQPFLQQGLTVQPEFEVFGQCVGVVVLELDDLLALQIDAFGQPFGFLLEKIQPSLRTGGAELGVRGQHDGHIAVDHGRRLLRIGALEADGHHRGPVAPARAADTGALAHLPDDIVRAHPGDVGKDLVVAGDIENVGPGHQAPLDHFELFEGIGLRLHAQYFVGDLGTFHQKCRLGRIEGWQARGDDEAEGRTGHDQRRHHRQTPPQDLEIEPDIVKHYSAALLLDALMGPSRTSTPGSAVLTMIPSAMSSRTMSRLTDCACAAAA